MLLDFEDLVIPKPDTLAGPGLVRLKEALDDQTNPLATFNEEE